MSELRVNSIEKRDGNNVSMSDPLRLKNYTTTQRDALTSVAGDTIYNTTTSKIEFYNGSAWEQTGGPDVVSIEYLIVAGGGGGGNGNLQAGGGGGGGGFMTNYASDNTGGGGSTRDGLYLTKSFDYTISVGAGGSGDASNYGGGAGTRANPPNSDPGGGGGSSYFAHPQVTSGSTTASSNYTNEGGGTGNPNYQAGTNEGGISETPGDGEDGYVLITAAATCATTTSTTIVSNVFAATNPVETGRVVVFEENIATPTLNTDIIASISRDGGTTFTAATLTDSGYVTGSSGQRILTGQATISGQPAGQSMRWKLALANNAVKIHGVSLQWS